MDHWHFFRSVTAHSTQHEHEHEHEHEHAHAHERARAHTQDQHNRDGPLLRYTANTGIHSKNLINKKFQLFLTNLILNSNVLALARQILQTTLGIWYFFKWMIPRSIFRC
jgi:ABC-type Zn2+ transport system substrate-binding protein/surface adhesin